jgi:hypothetical protein
MGQQPRQGYLTSSVGRRGIQTSFPQRMRGVPLHASFLVLGGDGSIVTCFQLTCFLEAAAARCFHKILQEA